MLLTELDYNLPPERIAQRPLDERDASRMLLLDRRTGAWEDRAFRECPDLLRGDELIVVNDARVIPARLLGRRVGVRSGTHGHSEKTNREFAVWRQMIGKGWCARDGKWASERKSFSATERSKPKWKRAASTEYGDCGSERKATLKKF